MDKETSTLMGRNLSVVLVETARMSGMQNPYRKETLTSESRLLDEEPRVLSSPGSTWTNIHHRVL